MDKLKILPTDNKQTTLNPVFLLEGLLSMGLYQFLITASIFDPLLNNTDNTRLKEEIVINDAARQLYYRDKIIKQIDRIATLDDGWNKDESTLKISHITITRVKNILEKIDDKFLNNWNVFPCANGSILFDYSLNSNVDASINFAEKSITAFFRTSYSKELLDNIQYEDDSIIQFFEKVSLCKNLCVKFLI